MIQMMTMKNGYPNQITNKVNKVNKGKNTSNEKKINQGKEDKEK